MNRVLKLILEGESLSTAQMAEVLRLDASVVETELEELKANGVILGWRPVLNPDFQAEDYVMAVIELKISPEREGGFDRLANRIAQFSQVRSCYLMSGAYDLMVVVSAKNLREVAAFVFERLATLHGVVSTATHFMLRAYKEQGYLLARANTPQDKPAVSA
ncbi:MAG: Lrp/AsnC family transcriptional regulator [Opitutales bacterium]|jgi:DNA-binding Lrp family transcriptional regulator